MLSNNSKGFTLLEVLVAVAVLGMVATGALRLSIAATRTLSAVRTESDLINRAQLLETDILNGSKPDSGEDHGLRWESMPYTYPMMDGLWQISFRQLEVTLDGHSITLYIP